MSEYHIQTVRVSLKKDSKLYRRVREYALREGVGLEAVIYAAMSLRGDKGITAGLDYLEKLRGL